MGCLEVSVYARREAAVDELKIFFPQLTIVGHNLDESAEVVGDVVVSTVPAGAADRVQLAAGTNIVFDVIYAPWPTALSKNAFALDIPVLGGLDLLVSQAVEQVLHMTQVSHDKRDVIFHAMYAAGAQEQAIRSQK
jgi:shikimate dehydrogenase